MSIGLLFYHMLNYIQQESTLSNVAWPLAINLAVILRAPKSFFNQFVNNENVKRRLWLAALTPFVAACVAGMGYVNLRGYISIGLKNSDITDTTVTRELYQTFDPLRGAFYVTNIEQASGLKSPWHKRATVSSQLRNRFQGDLRVLFISNYDALMHYAFQEPSSFDWANWYHAYSLDRQETISRVTEAIDSRLLNLVVIDGDPNCFDVSHDKPSSTAFVRALRANYELVEEYSGGYMYDAGTSRFVETSIAVWQVSPVELSDRQA